MARLASPQKTRMSPGRDSLRVSQEGLPGMKSQGGEDGGVCSGGLSVVLTKWRRPGGGWPEARWPGQRRCSPAIVAGSSRGLGRAPQAARGREPSPAAAATGEGPWQNRPGAVRQWESRRAGAWRRPCYHNPSPHAEEQDPGPRVSPPPTEHVV